MFKLNSLNTQKINKISLVVIPTCFIVFATLVGFVVNHISSSVANTSAVLNRSGVPLKWSSSITPATDLVSGVSAKLVNYNEYFVQYTPYLKNAGSSGHYLTHIASYLTTTSGDGHGFVPLGDSTIEYTYTPDQSDSWQHLAVSSPSNTSEGFKLTSPLYLAPDGTPMNTIYFRYGISADTSHSEYLNHQVSFLVTDESRANTTLSTTQTILAYEPTDSSTDSVIANLDPSEDDQTTKPLGVVDFVSNTAIIPSVQTVDTDPAQASAVVSSQAIMIIAISVFCSAMLLYIAFHVQQREC